MSFNTFKKRSELFDIFFVLAFVPNLLSFFVDHENLSDPIFLGILLVMLDKEIIKMWTDLFHGDLGTINQYHVWMFNFFILDQSS